MQTQISSSQRQLIRLFAQGYTDSEIAHKMALSPDQLQGVFADVCSQFRVADRIELLLMMWSSGGISGTGGHLRLEAMFYGGTPIDGQKHGK